MPGRIKVSKQIEGFGSPFKLPAEVDHALKNPPPPRLVTGVHPVQEVDQDEGPVPESTGPYPVVDSL